MQAKPSFLNKINKLFETSSFILWLQVEKTGEITYIHDRLTHQFDTLIHYLDKYPNVFDVFDFDKVKDISQAAASPSLFPIQQKFLNPCLTELVEDFYANVPVILLKVIDLKDGDFLGGVVYKGIFPNVVYDSQAVFLYVDQNNLIRGFNNNLFNYYGTSDRDPNKILNKNVAEFISPSPADFQKKFLKHSKDTEKRWYLCYDFAKEGTTKMIFPDTRDITVVKGRIEWNNRCPSELENITINKTFDTRKNDFKFEVLAETSRGSGPLLFLGKEKGGVFSNDFDTYLFGNLYIREGYILKRGANKLGFLDTKKASGKVLYTLLKIGKALICQVNGKTVLEYFDEEFKFNSSGCFAMGARAQSINRILDVKIYSRESAESLLKQYHTLTVTKSRFRPYRHFQLTRMFNPELNKVHGRYGDIDCYMLSDITHFQKTIDRFKSEYFAEKKQSRQLQVMLADYRKQEGAFVGSSKFVLEIKEKARSIADYSAPVLIEGPTGTGKEVVANFIHQQSGRRDHPMIKVDCSALPPNLIESELFGHEKGAFTGAVERKIGKFEQANKGTIFLDEVGNLTREIQAKLLNVLQDHTITRIGSTQAIKLDIRIIAATNIPLENLTRSGDFREDLYYRINTITIFLPALKDRLEDIPDLCKHFLSQFNANSQKTIKDLTSAAYKKLYQYSFPGNIRELKNVVHRAFIFCEKEFIDEEAIQIVQEAEPTADGGSMGKKKYLLKRMEKETMEALLKKHRGVIQAVADEIGVTRQACYYFLERKEIRLEVFQQAESG